MSGITAEEEDERRYMRKTALREAISSCSSHPSITTDEITSRAEAFYTYLANQEEGES